MIRHQQEKYSWQYTLIASNQSAKHLAQTYGIPTSNALTCADTAAGYTNAFSSASTNLAKYRTGTVRSMAFSDLDEHLQAEAGVIAQ